jgi:hypothetical protein
MGNRAVIAFKASPQIGIYVHWNGGRESVEAFLRATKERVGPSSADAQVGIARLTETIGRFFEGGLSVYVGLMCQLDTDNGDNGTFWIGDRWNIVSREHAPEPRAYDSAYEQGVFAECMRVNAKPAEVTT